jgi:hypothetical protein
MANTASPIKHTTSNCHTAPLLLIDKGSKSKSHRHRLRHLYNVFCWRVHQMSLWMLPKCLPIFCWKTPAYLWKKKD